MDKYKEAVYTKGPLAKWAGRDGPGTRWAKRQGAFGKWASKKW